MNNNYRLPKNKSLILLIVILSITLYFPINYLMKVVLDIYLNKGSLNISGLNNIKFLSSNFLYFYITFVFLLLLILTIKVKIIRILSKLFSINLIIVLFLAFLVRILWMILFPTGPVGDYIEYNNIALTFAETNSFPYPNIPYLPVGSIFIFGLIYKLFGSYLIIIKIFHIVISFFTIILFYKITFRLFGEKIASIFVVIYSFYPSHISMINITSPEVTMTFLFALFIYIFIASKNVWNKYIILGIIGGLLLYIKPVFIFALIVPFVYNISIKKYRNIVKSISIPVIALLIILPFSLSYGHLFIVNTSGGINLLIGNNDNSIGTYFTPSKIKELKNVNIENMSTFEQNKQYSKLAMDFIIKNPTKFILLIPKKLFHLLFKDTSMLTLSFEGLKIDNTVKWILYIFNSIYYYLIMLIAILSFSRKYIQKNLSSYLILTSFILSILLMFIIFFGMDRYKYPFMPLIIIFASQFIKQLLDKNNVSHNQIMPKVK